MGKLKAARCPGCHKRIGRHDAARYEEQCNPPVGLYLLWLPFCSGSMSTTWPPLDLALEVQTGGKDMKPTRVSLECFVWWPRSGGTPYLVKDLAYPSGSETSYLVTPLFQAFGERGKPQKVRITVEEIE